ncbi:putative nuclease HARBI1 [Haliotis cracherodii]|uniref:putative nuclease HARBI1 n=1 Tax=Haliotis cracherodii TaxID=6455 RepID=UPI0039E8AD68
MAAIGIVQTTARRDVLQIYSDKELIRRYRLNKSGIEYVTGLIADKICPSTSRSHAMTGTEKVVATLRYFATGKMQLCNGDDLGLSQSSVSRAIEQTVSALSDAEIASQFIHFPTTQGCIRRNQAAFYNIAHFPGVVGVIDGSHVQIIAPSVDEPSYVNRKQYHSINTQLVFDPNNMIIDLVAKWPGSTHDSRILTESGLHILFERHIVPTGCHLLGDSGYPCRNWLLTPYLRPNPGSQTSYNRAHKRTRSVVERGIGQLKRRFHVLHGEIRLSPIKACKIITCCGILHNICKIRNIPLPDSESNVPDDDMTAPYRERDIPGHNLTFRNHFANTHFQCE